MVIFTSICANYLHKARTLAKSVKDNIPDAKFIVSLLEKEIKSNYNNEYFDEIVLAKDCWGDGFERFIFKHTIVEASTSVKGRFFQYLYEKYPEEDKFVYLDPDVYVYSDFLELREVLEIRPIVLCPHLLQPGNIDMELSSTAHGVYNLGFLAVNRSAEARKFIDWWANRLSLFCYDEMGRGIFTDQKWIDLAPCFFDVEIFKHRGYDFAPWSLLDCGMYEKEGKVYVKGDELRFIHFSGYGSSTEKCMREWLPEGEHIFKKLYKEYSILHDSNNIDKISKQKWDYGFFNNGEKIKDNIRKRYRNDYNVMFKFKNPFEKSNKIYEELLSKNSSKKYKMYVSKAFDIYQREGLKSLSKKVIEKLFR